MNRFQKFEVKTEKVTEIVKEINIDYLHEFVKRIYNKDVTATKIANIKEKVSTYYFTLVDNSEVTVKVTKLELNLVKWAKKGMKLVTKPFKYE